MWIESHQEILNHPKTIRLSHLMGWSINETIGVLHRFWWWCLSYAEDGNLSKFTEEDINVAVGLNSENKSKLVDSMINSGLLDKTPVLRVHDWFDYAGRYLKAKYHETNPRKIEKIRKTYSVPKGSPKGLPKGSPKGRLKESNLPNLPNLPNQPLPTNLPYKNAREFISKYCESFKAKYGLNPHISEKDSGIARRLIQVPHIDTIMERFFNSQDKFILQNRHGLNIVESQINKLLVGEMDKYSGLREWLKKKEAEIGKQ